MDNNANDNQLPSDINTNALLLDDVPVGKSNFNLPQYPEESVQPTSNQHTMTQKITSKTVKLKLEGLDQLLHSLLSQKNEQQILQIQMSKILKENNPACLQKALTCMKQWIISEKRWNDHDTRSVIQNGYINGKNQSKKLSIQILSQMYENQTELVELVVLEGLKHKTPKIIGGYIGMINQLLCIHGPQKMKYLKMFFKDVVRVLNHQKLPIVKNQGISLLKNAYKWIGKEIVDSFIKDLKQTLKKQLDTFWQNHNSSQNQNQFLSVQQSTMVTRSKSKKPLDVYEIADGVEVFKHFDQKWMNSVLTADKWSQKVQMIQQLIKKVSVPKLINSDHRHIVQMIRRLLTDSNFNVVLTNLKLAATISKGLRKQFTHSAKSLFPLILSKMKEKKNQMIEETFHTLNDFYYSISIEDVSEDIKQGLKDKAPNMRSNIISWLGKFIERKFQQKGQLPQKTKDSLKGFSSIFQKLLSDGNSEVRDCMSKTLTRLKQLLGQDLFLSTDLNKSMKIIEEKNISKSKDKRADKSAKKISNDVSSSDLSKSSFFTKPQQYPVDISDEISKSLRKLNDANNWQNRRQSAQNLIKTIQRHQSKVIFKNFGQISTTLKTRINDPNKQLIKIFVQLIGLMFGCLSEKDLKFYQKPFIVALIEGLNDKMEANRRQITITLQKIGELVGQEQILAAMGLYLSGENQVKSQILSYIIKFETCLEKAQMKQFPKGIISCLCDKNKDIRSMAQHIFPTILEKKGIEIFRNLVKHEKPIYQNDLNIFLDKFDPREQQIPRTPSVRKLKRTNKPNHASLSQTKIQIDEQTVSNVSFTVKNTIEGDANFASLKVLALERGQRQEKQERYCFLWANQDEQLLKERVSKLFNKELWMKMFSSDYKKNLEVSSKIIKICKDLSQQPNIRETYDLILSWVALKLYGGNPALAQLIEVITPVLSILQKKKIALADRYLDMIFTIVREYVICTHWTQSANIQLLANIIKGTIALSSGFRTLKKVFQQFKIEILSQHKHCRRECGQYYRNILVQLICQNLSESINNDQILQQASKVKELADNPSFITILKNKFHHSILQEFGFCEKKSINISTVKSTFEKSQQKPLKTPTKPKQQEIQQFNSIQIQESSSSVVEHLNELDSYIDMSLYTFPNSYSVLSDNLNKLKNSTHKVSTHAITFFSTLFLENGKKIAEELRQYSSTIFASILNCLIKTIKFRNQNTPQKIISYALLLQQAIKCKHIFKNIDNNLFIKVIKFTTNQLVYEDQFRQPIQSDLKIRGIQYRPDAFIKAINGIMLRILQNSISQQSMNILLKILTESLPNTPPKKLGLIVKCIGRLSNNYDARNHDNQRYVGQFIMESVNYIKRSQIKNISTNPTLLNKSEEGILTTIKSILKQQCVEMRASIWKSYDEIRYKIDEEVGISEYILQYAPRSTYGSITKPANDDLKLINELLSKSKTFREGILRLKDYMDRNRTFNLGLYFKQMNYESKFIELVMKELEGEKIETKDNIGASINEKLKQLKLRFDGINIEKSQGQNLTPKHKRQNISKSTKNKSTIINYSEQENVHEMKRRIDDMKKRVNYTSTNIMR